MPEPTSFPRIRTYLKSIRNAPDPNIPINECLAFMDGVVAGLESALPSTAGTQWGPAWGFGRNVTGGAGKTNLTVNDIGDGSGDTLRAQVLAAPADGATITFAPGVRGTIRLDPSKGQLRIANKNNLSIIFPTDGGGVTVTQHTVWLQDANNIEIRNGSFRLGNFAHNRFNDVLSAVNCTNVLIDKCSFAWSLDEIIDFSGVTDGTIQRCIVCPPLNKTGHPHGVPPVGMKREDTPDSELEHGLCALINGKTSLIGNIFGFARFRPQCSGNIQIASNIFYNYESSYPIILLNQIGDTFVDVTDNQFIEGPAAEPPGHVRSVRIATDDVSLWFSSNSGELINGSAFAVSPVLGSVRIPGTNNKRPVELKKPTQPHFPELAVSGIDARQAGAPESDNLDIWVRTHLVNKTGDLIDQQDDFESGGKFGFDAL